MSDQIIISVDSSQLQLKSSLNPSDTVLITDANGKVLLKASISDIVRNSGISFSGNIGGIADPSTTPIGGTPTNQVIYFSGIGTFPNFKDGSGAQIITTAPLNILANNGTVTTVLPINLNLSNYPQKSEVQELAGLSTKNGNLFNAADPNNMPNYGMNDSGDIVSYGGSIMSAPIPVSENTNYDLTEFTSATTGVQYQDENGHKLENPDDTDYGFVLLSSIPATFRTPPGCVKLQFECKKPTDATIPPNGALTLSGVPSSFIGGDTKKIAADFLNAGAKINGDAIATYNDLLIVKQSVKFDKTNPLIKKGSGIDNKGDVSVFPGTATSYPFLTAPNTSYVLDGVTNTDTGIQFQDVTGKKIGYIVLNSIPGRFTTPPNCYRYIFNCKQPSDSAIPTDITITPIGVTGLEYAVPVMPIIGQSKTLPFQGLIILGYGDSTMVAFLTTLAPLMNQYLGVSNFTSYGQSGQSWGGLLQSDSNLTPLLAANPDLIIMHSVNAHRNNEVLGSMADAPGTPSTYGGLKYILNKMITNNKNVKIILCTPYTYGQTQGPNVIAFDQPNTQGLYGIDYTDAIIRVARSYGITIVDLSSLLGLRPAIESTTERVYTREGVHLNDGIGYPLFVQEIANVVNNLIVA